MVWIRILLVVSCIILVLELCTVIWAVWTMHPWQCKICGLPGYPHGCRGHCSPPLDIELIFGTLWPHLPKHCIALGFPKLTKGIEVYAADGIVELGNITLTAHILTLRWIETPKPRFYDQVGTPQVKKTHTASWNIADPNSTMQIVNKIMELRNGLPA
jgi:hypothetical protein